MKNLVDRISFKYVLNPFIDISEMKKMIDFRVQTAGKSSRRKLFDDVAMEEIYRATQGFPRRIGMLCHNALRELVMQSKKHVTGDMIRELVSHEMVL